MAAINTRVNTPGGSTLSGAQTGSQQQGIKISGEPQKTKVEPLGEADVAAINKKAKRSNQLSDWEQASNDWATERWQQQGKSMPSMAPISAEGVEQTLDEQASQQPQSQPEAQPDIRVPSGLTTIRPNDTGMVDVSGLGTMMPQSTTRAGAISMEAGAKAYGMEPPATPEPNSEVAGEALLNGEATEAEQGSEDSSPAQTDSDTEETTPEPKSKPKRPSKGMMVNQANKGDQQVIIDNRMPSLLGRLVGWKNRDRTPKFMQPSMKRPGKLKKRLQNQAKERFSRSGVGFHVYGKVIGNSTLDFETVGVGCQDIMAAIRQNPRMISKLFTKWNNGEPVNVDETWEIKDVIDWVNEHPIWVATFKSPDNRGPDIQGRRLKVMDEARGVYLHPAVIAMYTADTDGDDMCVSFNPSTYFNTWDPMEHLIGIDGEQTFDTKFMPLAKIIEQDGKTPYQYVRTVMLSKYSFDLEALAKAVVDLGETVTMSGDDQAKAWGKVFREARKASLREAKSRRAQNLLMAELVKAVYDGMHQISLQAYFMNAPTYKVEPVTYEDNAIFRVVDGIVDGRVPNNFQDLKLMLTGFVGNVEGQNAPFRFSADVGKMMKIDPRFQIGDEFVIDPNNEQQMNELLNCTLKTAASRTMAKNLEIAGRSTYYTQLLRENIIKEVGFYDSVDKDGNRIYASFNDFLMRFRDSYNIHASTINEANAIFLANMGITRQENLVTPLRSEVRESDKQNVVMLKNIAGPFSEIYGTYSVRRMFRELAGRHMRQTPYWKGFSERISKKKGVEINVNPAEMDPFWQGNPNQVSRSKNTAHQVEREYDYYNDREKFWVTGKYLEYSLSRFKIENRLLLGDKGGSGLDMNDVRNRTLEEMSQTDDINNEFLLLLAIADKRTSASSKFNVSTYGKFGDEDAKLGKDEKSDIQMMSENLIELNRLNGMSPFLAPGYYAGVGSRKAPQQVLNAMTNLAKRLSDQNWCVRSGHATGSDQAFELGAGKNAVTYLPWAKFEKDVAVAGTGQIFDSLPQDVKDVAMASVEKYHPTPEKLKDSQKKLIARDYFQVVGIADDPDSAFVACYAKRDDNGVEQGGTAQAIRIARSRGIPVFNAYDYIDEERNDYSGLEKWQNDVMDAAAKSMAGQLHRRGAGKEQMYWVNNTIDTLIQSNPDVFCHFGMDSPAGFLQSIWGKMMMEHANDLGVLGGIRATMVYLYKTERISALQAELDAVDKKDMDRFRELWTKLSLAKDELSASSETWHGIIKEFEAELQGKSVFKYFKKENRQGKIKKKYRTGNIALAPNQILDAKQFWLNDTDHDSLEDVMNDPMIDAKTKFAIVADIVRYWENDAYLKSFEASYQLEYSSNSTFSMTGSMTSPLKQHREYEESFNKWGKRSLDNLQENIGRASEMYRNREGWLLGALENIDKRPWSFVQISDHIYADSLMSVLDKTYAQTEKASQHPWTNAIYTALGMQRNGGPKHDIYRTDNRLLGLVGVEDVGIEDVIHILANPEEELWVYDDEGGVGFITRDLLLESALGHELSGNVEADIWEFLETMPHIAAAIRLHDACVMSDSKGTGYIGATCSTAETIAAMHSAITDPIDHVKYLMRDHPVYGGLIMLAMPTKGVISRNHRERAVKMENYLAYKLYEGARGKGDPSTIATIILNDLGITETSIYNALRSDYDVFLEKTGLPKLGDDDPKLRDTEAADDARLTYSETLHPYMVEYIKEIRKNVDLSTELLEFDKPEKMGVDAASMAAFWDTVQELGGAKTAVSTGVEGWETWQYSLWASHIDAKDQYADLAWVRDDITPEWNNAWTSLTDDNGKMIPLQVDENGNIINQFSYKDPNTGDVQDLDIFQWMEKKNIGSVAVVPPEGYVIQDRSTDSHGTPIPSLFTYMVSKRSNGAEAFNLKAKKAGIDKSDSITKMKGKYRMIEYKDEDGNTYQRPANYYDIQYELQVIAAEKGIIYAKQKLAEMMLKENEELGYKDMSLANYMSMADIMLIQGDDGLMHLRSLEMLFSAIKGRLIGDIEDMTDQEIRDAANLIVHDTSMETGVGMRAIDPLDAFSQLGVKGKASPSFGRRTNSSVFARNYMLLEEIQKKNYNTAEHLTGQQIEELDKWITDKEKGVWDLRKTKIKLVRDYNIVGFTATTDKRESMREDLHWVVGPTNAIYIGKDISASEDNIAKICDKAYDLGMTVIVSSENRNKIPDKYCKDCMPCSEDGDVLIPMFDMRLNGSESQPVNSQFAIFQAPYSRYTQCVEDPINFYQLADAQYKPTRAFTNRIKVVDRRTKRIKADDLFRNVFGNMDFTDNSLKVSLASADDIEQLIANGVKCTIDYGVAKDSNEFKQRQHDVDQAIARYQKRWGETNADGNFVDGKTECEPGDIVAWAMLEMTDPLTEDVSYVLAPIIPYQLHETKAALAKFVVTSIGYVDRDHTNFSIDMQNTSEIGEGYAKYFDSSGGANKGMINFVDSIETNLMLRDGTSVDMYCAKASTDSRKVGTDRRIKTMISLMAKARMRGYNFARVDGSFPDNPELKERMLHERIPMSEWKKITMDDGFRFTSDKKLDAFLQWECGKILKNGGNPSDYLANVFTDAEGNEHNTHIMWEFEAMFEQGLNYEDSLLHFLHTMDPSFCPDGLADDTENHLFRLKKDDKGIAKDYDRGVLEMQVPYEYKGNIVYKWANVYIGMSFFSDDYSGFSRPNVEGASVMLDGMNTMSYYGIQLDQAAVLDRSDWATSDYGAIPRDGGVIGTA